VTIDAALLKAWPFEPVRHTYTARDTILYALGLGLGRDPLDAAQLRHTYERGLQALPTMAVVLGSPGFWAKDPRTRIDWVRLLHGEQELELHAPLPVAGTVIGVSRVTRLVDKGAGKGALMYSERTLTDEGTGVRLATARSVSFLRGDGGFAAHGQSSDEAPPARPPTPDTPPQITFDWPIRPEAALIYRLSGDDNPLHADPAVAAAAGFQAPILHGLCSFGMTGWALTRALCGGDAARLQAIGTRFAAPVFPGETLRVEIWRHGDAVQFRTRVLERDLIVLSHGTATLG
jgi:acyl dehydratase